MTNFFLFNYLKRLLVLVIILKYFFPGNLFKRIFSWLLFQKTLYPFKRLILLVIILEDLLSWQLFEKAYFLCNYLKRLLSFCLAIIWKVLLLGNNFQRFIFVVTILEDLSWEPYTISRLEYLFFGKKFLELIFLW